MRLFGAVTEGSGAVNEDGWGIAGSGGEVRAAWVFDGVTGINGRDYLGEGSDAAWLVARAQVRLQALAAGDLPLQSILDALVDGLCEDWRTAAVAVPGGYDPPAACLIIAKRYDNGWKALRLGDSCLLSRRADGTLQSVVPESAFDHRLAAEAGARRKAGVFDMNSLREEFRPQLLASRQRRNREGGYGILEADPAAKRFGEFIDLGFPREILICSDGYYRAVDHYGLHSDASLLATSDVDRVLADLREVEMGDPLCQRYPRFKPADDATAVMLGASDETRRL